MNGSSEAKAGPAGSGRCRPAGRPQAQRPAAGRLGPGPRFVGLDVHKRQLTACIIDAQGRLISRFSFALTDGALAAFCDQLQPTDQVALEATTNCWAVAQRLRQRLPSVTVSNPLLTKAIAQSKVKTDKVDAAVLAQLLRCGYLPTVWQPDAQTRRLRELSARRAALVQDRTAVRNRIHSVLATRLLPAPPALFTAKGLGWLQSLLSSERLDEPARLMITADLAVHQSLQEQIERFDQRLAQEAYRIEPVRLLMTLPGVDVTVAVSLVAAIGDVRRFGSPGQLCSYLGLVPSTRQSAQRCYHGPITKRGRSQARWMAIQAAQHLIRHPGPLGHFFRRLKRRKNHNIAVVATARKLVTVAWHMLTSGQPYRYAVPRATESKLARLRVRATGQRRRSGPAKGQKAVAKLPGGSRTIKALDRIYAQERLPQRRPLPAGEARMLQARQLDQFVQSLNHDHLVPRQPRPPKNSTPPS